MPLIIRRGNAIARPQLSPKQKGKLLDAMRWEKRRGGYYKSKALCQHVMIALPPVGDAEAYMLECELQAMCVDWALETQNINWVSPAFPIESVRAQLEYPAMFKHAPTEPHERAYKLYATMGTIHAVLGIEHLLWSEPLRLHLMHYLIDRLEDELDER